MIVLWTTKIIKVSDIIKYILLNIGKYEYFDYILTTKSIFIKSIKHIECVEREKWMGEI